MSAAESQTVETTPPPAKQPAVRSGDACKTVLFVTNTDEFGGAERHLLELIARLRIPGVQLSVLCLGDDLFTKRLDPNSGVHVFKCEQLPSSLRQWVSLFRTSKPDVIVFVYNWFWSLPPIVPVSAWLAGIRKRISIQHLITPPLMPSPQAKVEWNRRRSIRGLAQWMLGRKSPRIANLPLCIQASLSGPLDLRLSGYLPHTTICVSDAVRDSLAKEFGFPVGKTRTIHNGVSLSEFAPRESAQSGIRAKLGIGPDEFVFVCVARLSEQKGIDILLQAIARVLRDGVHCKCVIVGDGPLGDRLREQARELGLSGDVFFEGFREDVRPYFQAGSAFILTSHREGMPLSILEAMACGLPSIVTNVGGNAEAVTDRVHGLVIAPGSVDAVVDAISYLVTHPRERLQMSRMARATACEAFDIETRMADIKRVILN